MIKKENRIPSRFIMGNIFGRNIVINKIIY